jgi:hypothetical protein
VARAAVARAAVAAPRLATANKATAPAVRPAPPKARASVKPTADEWETF